MNTLLPLAFLTLTACAAQLDIIPGQLEAEQIVWREVYGMTQQPYAIEWVRQAELDCEDKDGHTVGFLDADGVCVGGETHPEVRLCRVALPDGYAIWRTAYAHELLHTALLLKGGDGDSGHVGAEWKRGGALERANVELRDKQP